MVRPLVQSSTGAGCSLGLIYRRAVCPSKSQSASRVSYDSEKFQSTPPGEEEEAAVPEANRCRRFNVTVAQRPAPSPSMAETTEQTTASGEASVTRDSKSTLESGGSSSDPSKEAFVESQVESTRIGADESARRKRLLYAGLLAGATLAVTAMLVATFASSSKAGAQGAAGETTEFEETENPWPTVEERRVTAEEEGYLYYKRRTTNRKTATLKPKSKRKRRRGKATEEQTTTTTATPATTFPDTSTVSFDGRSEEPEHARGRLGGVRDADLGSRGSGSRANASDTNTHAERTSSPSKHTQRLCDLCPMVLSPRTKRRQLVTTKAREGSRPRYSSRLHGSPPIDDVTASARLERTLGFFCRCTLDASRLISGLN
ncbi:uncharacterized protein LOC125940866 [Dermacentor silvarum]|uniref:uncharacterized protein LOC125940866 n=1 Tax=Dermacentor silvarum TaxID=543639 RepID=UPI0021019B79|nr:uncharacterized protein LOC125940866 [Dermacentor silvarum]